MKFDIVIAHYKEDVTWLNNLYHESIRNIIVYNKDKESPLNNTKVINKQLPNIGREAHTYLTYCVEYYNNLPEFVIFLQGSPHHGINVHTILNWINSIIQSRIDSTGNYGIGNIDWFLRDGRISEWGGPVNQSQYSVKEWAQIYVRPNLKEHQYPIFWNACFGVSKKAILSNPSEKYQKIITNELQGVNSETAHYLERLWYYLFNLDIINQMDSLNKTVWLYWGARLGKSPTPTKNCSGVLVIK